MFALFYSLYYAMFVGYWGLFTINDISQRIYEPMRKIGILVTSIFNNVNTPMDNWNLSLPEYFHVVSFILALITSIGIVVFAAKGVKKAFGIFFGQIR